ncbi:MAG: thiamine phosphate synthase [Candidatus Atribacteria bacterium]|nr:thiamine phosphate synthase [Candidatus Atribacteria bacterium]
MIDYSLYVITNRDLQRNRSTIEVVEEVIRGGATIIQLREKNLSTRVFFENALTIRKITKPAGIPLIINDRMDIALAVNADGIHLGEEDLPLKYARKIAPHLIIGYSADSVLDAQQAEKDGADYLGVGSVFPTTTKVDAGPAIGIQRLKEIKKSVSIPVVAIGGINLTNLPEVIKAGVDGVAVVSAIVADASPFQAAKHFRFTIDSLRKEKDVNPN